MPEISQQVLWNSSPLPATGQTSHFQTLQTEHDIVAHTPPRDSMAEATLFLGLNDNHIPGGPQCGAVNPAYDHGVVELGLHYREGHPVTSLSRGTRDKRKRDSNWTVEETSILVGCKKEAAVDNASRFCKGKGDVINWDLIADEINSNLGTTSIFKTGNNCRLRWDTLVKSYQKLKEYCSKNGRQFSDLTRLERVELKLATTLSEAEWFEVIDKFCPPKSRKSKSRKLDTVVSSVDTPPCSLHDSTHSHSSTQIGIESFEAREPSWMEAGAMQDIAASGSPRSDWNAVALEPAVQTESRSFEFHLSPRKELGVAQVMPGSNVMNGELYPADCGLSLIPVSEPRKSSAKQVAIPGFTSMSQDLKFTILNLVQAWPTIRSYSKIGKVCRWLAIVQDRSPSKTQSYVFSLLNRNPLAISSCFNKRNCRLKSKRLRVYKKFCKVVINRDLDFNVHRVLWDDNMLSLELSLVLQRIRVLTLFKCAKLKRVDLAKLPMLRSLSIQWCLNLKEIRGWENLNRLGWLEILEQGDLHDGYLRVHCLPSLEEVYIECHIISDSDDLEEFKLDFSQCVRLRKVDIYGSRQMKSVDLSTLNFLEAVKISNCPALESIVGLSESLSLTKITFSRYPAMERVPYLGHLKALAKLKLLNDGAFTNTGFENLHLLTHLELICGSAFNPLLPDLSGLKELTYLKIHHPGVEEIRGLEKLHSLTVLDLYGCKALKRLPYLGDLKVLGYLNIVGCGVDEIPGVRELVNLETLRCGGSKLEWLPDLRHLPRLDHVYLGDTPLVRASSSKYFEKPGGLPRVESKEGGQSAEWEEGVSDADYVPSDQEVYDRESGGNSDDSCDSDD